MLGGWNGNTLENSLEKGVNSWFWLVAVLSVGVQLLTFL